MTLARTSLARPSLSYRLIGALTEAASQAAPGRTGYSLLLSRTGRPLASIRAYGDSLFLIFSGNQELNSKLALTPGFAARCRFAQALGAAESNAHVKEW